MKSAQDVAASSLGSANAAAAVRRARLLKRTALWGAVLILLAAGTGAAAAASLRMPYQAFQGEAFVDLDRGAGTLALGRALQQAGVIRYAWQFWLARAFRSSAKLTAGEYRFAARSSVDAIFDRIKKGKITFGSAPWSLDDGKLNDWGGGRGLYFRSADGHVLEIMTVPQ